jgi:NAD dependent epimerase/dehydratase family enzyme
MRIFVTGGTGLVGTRLIRRLRQRKDDVVLLTRRPEVAKGQFADCQVIAGDPTQDGPWKDAVRDCDAVVNLAGENIFAQRWDDRFKFQMRESRVRSTDNVVAALAAQPKTAAGQPKVLVNASAIGYYGPHGDEELDETSPPGSDFLSRLAIDWGASGPRGLSGPPACAWPSSASASSSPRREGPSRRCSCPSSSASAGRSARGPSG